MPSISPIIKRHMRRRSESVCETQKCKLKQNADLEVEILTAMKRGIYPARKELDLRQKHRPDNPLARKFQEEPERRTAFTPLRRSKIVAQ